MTTAPDDGIVHLGRGTTWNDGLREYEILYLTPREGSVVCHVKVGAEYQEWSVAEMARKRRDDHLLANPRLNAIAQEGDDVAGLPAEVLAAAIELRSHINEARTGYPGGVPVPGQKPDRRYDPDIYSSGRRKEHKAKQLGIARTTFYDIIARYDKAGGTLKSLVHGNRFLGAPLTKHDPGLIDAVEKFVTERRKGSRMGKQAWIAAAQNVAEEAGHKVPGYSAMKEVLEELTRGNSPWQRTKTVKSKASRRVAGTGWAYTEPGEVWEIDCTPCDFHVRVPGEPGWANCWAVSITDVGDGDVTTLLTPAPPNSRALGVALFRRLFPDEAVCGPPLFPPTSLPRQVDITEGLATISGLAEPTRHLPGRVVMDHGREGENAHFLGLLTRLMVNVEFTRPRTGSDKPHIESAMRLNALASEGIPGSKGSNTLNRGDHPERAALFTLTEAQVLVDIVNQQLRDNPRSGNRHPQDSKTYLSPRERANISLLNGVEVRLPLRTNLLYEFLPSHRATVNNNRVSVKGRVYSSEDGALMKRLTAISAGDEKVQSRPLLFRYDPYDPTRLFWHEPGTLNWHRLREINTKGLFVTPFSEIWYSRMRKVPLAGKQNSKTRGTKLARDRHKAVSRLAELGLTERDLSREFTKVLNSVPDPASVPAHDSAELAVNDPSGAVVSGRTSSEAGPRSGEAADFASVELLPDPDWSTEGGPTHTWVEVEDTEEGTQFSDLDVFTLDEIEDPELW